MSPEDWALFERIGRPGSTDCILNSPDYRAFFTYSMFWGNVPD